MDCRKSLFPALWLLFGALGCSHTETGPVLPQLHETSPPPLASGSSYAPIKHDVKITKRNPQPETCVAFGDIFLADLRAYREQNLARLGMRAIFPLWQRDTRELAREFGDLGLRAVVAAIDPQKLDRSFVGRELTPEFFRELPPEVDPCGENGEFHTFVFAGPIFSQPIEIERGPVVERDGFVFCDLREKRR